MIDQAKKFIRECAKTSIYKPNLESLTDEDWKEILVVFKTDAERYGLPPDFLEAKYFPGLLATFFYRIATVLYHSDREHFAKDYSYLGFSLSGSELYYSAKIGKGLKINHGMGVIIGANVIIGHNVTLHHNVGMGRLTRGSPKIGDNVVIFPDSSIASDITIGDNAIIGNNNFVNRDVAEGEVIKKGALT